MSADHGQQYGPRNGNLTSHPWRLLVFRGTLKNLFLSVGEISARAGLFFHWMTWSASPFTGNRDGLHGNIAPLHEDLAPVRVAPSRSE